jgi:hypothetical protein
VTGLALAIIAAAQAGSTPVGPLPVGQVSTTTTAPNQLVAVALPRAPRQSGLVWRRARRYDSHIVRQISEADVGANVLVVFKVVGRGNTSLVFALTRGRCLAQSSQVRYAEDSLRLTGRLLPHPFSWRFRVDGIKRKTACLDSSAATASSDEFGVALK